MGTSPRFRHYFNRRQSLTPEFFLMSSWCRPPCSSHLRGLREGNCSSWCLISQGALSFKMNSPQKASVRPHGMNSCSFDKSLSGLAPENTQSLYPIFPHLTWAHSGLSTRDTLKYLILSPGVAQHGQEGGTHLPVGGDCCKHSRRVWCPGHITHG